MREVYRELLSLAIESGGRFALIFLLAMAATALLAFPLGPLPGLGQDFFPTVDAGQLKLHLRASTGTRIEQTAILCDEVERDCARNDPTERDHFDRGYRGVAL